MSDMIETELCTIYTLLEFLMLVLVFALYFVVVNFVFFFLVQSKSTSSTPVKTTLRLNSDYLFY